jgi:PAS domain S-box-containing protein
MGKILMGRKALQASERPASQLSLLHAVAVAANEAANVEDALQTCLDAVCAHTAWPLGHAWLMDADGSLASTGIWHLAEPGCFPRFREATAQTRLAPGEGVAGRVLASGEPEWIEDISWRTDLVRVVAREEGIRAGIAFPVRVGREVAGVLEFFSGQPLPRDVALLGVMVNLGTQVGRVVERARAQEALRLSEAKFAGIMSISSDAIVSVDEAQRIVFFNLGAEHTFGYAAGEVVGEPLELLVPEAHRAGHAEHVRAFGAGPVAARRMGERGQISGRRKGGEVFPADASISRLEVGGRRIYTAVIRDVTERVRIDEALARQTEALARQGEELARSNADLEQFAYVASHDLQEPLRMVSSYAQLLSRRYRDWLDDDAREFIGYMVDGVDRMRSLIGGLLTFSRLGSGGDAHRPVALDGVLERALANLEAAIKESGAVVTADPLPTVVGDPAQLAQLFQNLVGNGVKFRGEAAPRVHVSAERDGGEWRLSVCDNGIGIEPEYAERIFVIFQRLHGRAEYPGTGIGLALCRKIVERHGGRIWVESRAGAGSSFFFTLPAVQAGGGGEPGGALR